MDALGADDPRIVGGYQVFGLLGRGGMGRVYLARAADGGGAVALKVVNRELAGQDEFRNRFRREVRAARTVGGERTARVLDADTEAETPWVATEYVPGLSLAEVVGSMYGPLPARSLWALADGLGRALRAIHSAGLVHRDLKPSNVLLAPDGPRVIDFGIARHVAQTATTLTRTGITLGSPGYMAPEQVLGEQIGPAADVFCLGAVLAYAATGVAPFGDPAIGPHAQMFRIVEGEPDLGELASMDGDLHALIVACLRKPAEERPGVDEVLERTAGKTDGSTGTADGSTGKTDGTAGTADGSTGKTDGSTRTADGDEGGWLPADLVELLERQARRTAEELAAADASAADAGENDAGTVVLRGRGAGTAGGSGPEAAAAPTDPSQQPRGRTRARRLLVVCLVFVTVVVTGVGAWVLLPWAESEGSGGGDGSARLPGDGPSVSASSAVPQKSASPSPSESDSASPSASASRSSSATPPDPSGAADPSPSSGDTGEDGDNNEAGGPPAGDDSTPDSGAQFPAAFAGTWADGQDTVVIPSAPDNGKTVTVTYYDDEGWCRYVHTITGVTSTRIFLDQQEMTDFSPEDHQCASEATDGWHVARVDDDHIRYGSPSVTYVFTRT
ncbi:serine/threonine protein kinase [Streptomyces sp. PSKA54]|uniref:Serine/threonine protein kinase n=1 Tax=Streptomyces himalayensis subsp. aureolus TaxID=2758039 RepID=A0A7W2D4V5_9ACTN|nr:serine/threonine-protein kinase [Streptomyces himalayensis]MBA4864801.1 serine/threonine protein kinase [Streptomyces himalayensis subsp. aureolus]